MRDRNQAITSAICIVACLLLVLDRVFHGSYGWALMWAVVTGVHVWILVDIVRGKGSEWK